MEYRDFTFLDVQVRDGIAFVTLNNPGHANAYDRRGHREMSTILRRLMEDPSVRAAVISGAGDAFSAGPLADPTAPANLGPGADVSATIQEVRDMIYGAIECDKPVACALNGVVRGGALSFALTADVVIAERQVTLADTHVLVALTAGDGGVLTWPMAMGLLRAKKYLLTGDPLRAEDAERLGLVTEVVDAGMSLARATRYATRWAAGPAAALRTTKRALNQWLRLGALTAFDLSLAFEHVTLQSDEAARAVERLQREGRGAVPPDSA